MFVRLRERTTLAGGAGTCNSDGGRQDCSPVARFRYTGWPDGSRATSQDGGSDCGSIGGTGVARETMCGSMLSAACCRHRAGSLGSTRSSGLHSGPGLEPERWQNICASQRTTRRTPPMMMLLWSNSKPTRPYTRAPPCIRCARSAINSAIRRAGAAKLPAAHLRMNRFKCPRWATERA